MNQESGATTGAADVSQTIENGVEVNPMTGAVKIVRICGGVDIGMIWVA